MMRSNEFITGGATPLSVARPTRLHREIAISPELLATSRCDPDGALGKLGCTDAGLDEAEAGPRLKRFGLNQIAQENLTSLIHELIDRTKNPLNALLLTLAVISYSLGDVRAAIVIATMVILSIVTAFIQEHRSNQAAAKLRALVKTTASVKRQGLSAAVRPSQVQGVGALPMWALALADLVPRHAAAPLPGYLAVPQRTG